jgi:hypothetical protein
VIRALETLLPLALALRNARPAVPTDIHERPDHSVFTAHDQLRDPGMIASQIISWVCNLATQSNQQWQSLEQRQTFSHKALLIGVVRHRVAIRGRRKVGRTGIQMAEYLVNQCDLKRFIHDV